MSSISTAALAGQGQVAQATLLGRALNRMNQPMPNNMFSVMIGGDPIGFFSKVSGIEYSITPYQIKEGGRNHSPHYRPFDGPGQSGEVTLEWGSVTRDKMGLGFIRLRRVCHFDVMCLLRISIVKVDHIASLACMVRGRSSGRLLI